MRSYYWWIEKEFKGILSERSFGTSLLIMTVAFEESLLILSPYDVYQSCEADIEGIT